MATFYVIVNKENGHLFEPFAFQNQNRPIPSTTQYIAVTESNSDYALLYALFIHDENRIAVDYAHPSTGGVTYDWTTQRFVCVKQTDLPINVDNLRKMRNELLNATDALTHVPDFPAGFMEALVSYRTELRDVTKNVTNGTWITDKDVVWPEYPEILKPKLD